MRELPNIDPHQPIAIDLETCDPELRTLAPGYVCKVGFVAGFAIAAKEGSFYIPVGHLEGYNYDMIRVVEWLNKILSADTDKVMHNAQYDLGWLKYVGVQVHGKVFDTMLAAALLNENRRVYSLDSIGQEYLGEGKNEVALESAVKAKYANVKAHKTKIRLKEKNVSDYTPFYEAKIRICPHFDLYPPEIQNHYDIVGHELDKHGHALFKVPTRTERDIKGLLWSVNADTMGSYPIQDVDLTYRLYKHFLPLLQQQNLMTVMDLENELLPCLLEMREQGVKIDLKKAEEIDKDYTQQLLSAQKELDDIAGFNVNVDAETTLVQLCEKLNLKYQLTAKGSPCFDKNNCPQHKAFDLVLKIRALNKARNTYIRGYFFAMSYNGRIHGQYNQLKSDEGGTVTGRLSASNPNLQNIPARGEFGKIMRTMFIPDSSDEEWLCMDFSGQEPKMLVNLVLMLDNILGTKKIKDEVTGEIRIEHTTGFPGADLARKPEFSGRKADFHTAVAKICMDTENKHNGVNVSEEELNQQAAAFRSKAKSIGLGTMYGSGPAKIAEGMQAKGVPITVEEARDLRNQVLTAIPFLDAVNKYVMELAKRRGYVLTLLKRRGRFDIWEIPLWDIDRGSVPTPYFKSMEEANKWMYSADGIGFAQKYKCTFGRPQRAFSYKALNKIIQGSSADQTKTAMLHLYKRNQMEIPALDIYYRRSNIEPPKMRVQVHDEINFSIRPGENIDWYQDTMEHSFPLQVESVAEPGTGKTWAEAK